MARKRINAFIDADIVDRLAARCVSERRTDAQVIETALRDYLDGTSAERILSGMRSLADRVDRRHAAIEACIGTVADFVVDVRRAAR